jgi:hypothetical protein
MGSRSRKATDGDGSVRSLCSTSAGSGAYPVDHDGGANEAEEEDVEPVRASTPHRAKCCAWNLHVDCSMV